MVQAHPACVRSPPRRGGMRELAGRGAVAPSVVHASEAAQRRGGGLGDSIDAIGAVASWRELATGEPNIAVVA